jgi:putative spermidine/putrescine transport system ATP-binding protein/spermidine/putrescine transport system ATP-binding protein
VAGFLGDANFLDGTVTGRNASRLEIATALGHFSVEAGEASGAGAGRRVTLVVRPEAVGVARAPERVPGAAVVRSTVYLGAEALYELARDGVSLLSRVQLSGSAELFGEGAKVAIAIDPSAIHVLAD